MTVLTRLRSLRAVLSRGGGKLLLDWRKLWLLARCWPETMVDFPRLLNAYELVNQIEAQAVAGAVVECGVWRGGCAAVMAKVCERWGGKRDIFLFDSFVGLPQPSVVDGVKARIYARGMSSGRLVAIDRCVGSLKEVSHFLFGQLGLSSRLVHLVPGWFQKTVPASKKRVRKIALLRLDADWYESTKICLVNFYPLVEPGGYVIVDDYGTWPGAKKAVDEYRRKQGIMSRLAWIDSHGVFWQKG